MIAWYDPQADEIVLQYKGWWLFITEDFPGGNLHFIPRPPWIKLGDL